MRKVRLLGLLAAFVLGSGGHAVRASHVPYATGDVFVAVEQGLVGHFNSAGILLEILDTTVGPSGLRLETGMCFDAGGNLYTTNFTTGNMSKFDNQGGLLVHPWASGFSTHPESCVLDLAQNIYVGEVVGENLLRKFDVNGAPLGTFAPAVQDKGIDWIDLASDQCTLYYTSEGTTIKRFDVCANSQLADFTTLPLVDDPTHDHACYALRIRANGEVVVACSTIVGPLDPICSTGIVFRLNPDGSVNASYPVSDCLFALNLDPDGSHVWTAGGRSGNVYKIDLQSGAGADAPLFNAFSQGLPIGVVGIVGGLAIFGEPTAAVTPAQITLEPPSAQNPAGSTHTVTASILAGGTPLEGILIGFEVTAGPNAGQVSDAGECAANSDCTTAVNGEVSWTYGSNGAVGIDTIVACFTDELGEHCAEATKEWVNQAPDCLGAVANPSQLWPPNHRLVSIQISGVTDPDGDPIGVTIQSIRQDEPVKETGTGSGNTCPDGFGVGASTAQVRAERAGNRGVPGDGRVYHIAFTAADGRGGTCGAEVLVCVPHDRGSHPTCTDQGPLFDSTVCP